VIAAAVRPAAEGNILIEQGFGDLAAIVAAHGFGFRLQAGQLDRRRRTRRAARPSERGMLRIRPASRNRVQPAWFLSREGIVTLKIKHQQRPWLAYGTAMGRKCRFPFPALSAAIDDRSLISIGPPGPREGLTLRIPVLTPARLRKP